MTQPQPACLLCCCRLAADRDHKPDPSHLPLWSCIQSGRGGKPGAWRERPADADAEAAEQDRAISRLMQEARRYYDGPISAAHDFFRFDVQQPAASHAMGPEGSRGRR